MTARLNELLGQENKMTILKRNESIGSAIFGVALRLERLTKTARKLVDELDEQKHFCDQLRELAEMLGSRLADEIGDEATDAIYEAWEKKMARPNAQGNKPPTTGD